MGTPDQPEQPEANPWGPQLQSLQERVSRALAGYDQLNTHLPSEADWHYTPAPNYAQAAGVAALVDVLEAIGLHVRVPWVMRSLTLQAEALEGSLRECTEDFRQKTGIIVPMPFVNRPKG